MRIYVHVCVYCLSFINEFIINELTDPTNMSSVMFTFLLLFKLIDHFTEII